MPQSGLTKEERVVNLEGAFAVTENKVIRGKRILLIDDIFTTGTTINYCAKELMEKRLLLHKNC